MSTEKDRIITFTTDEIAVNDTQKPAIDDEVLPPIDENIDSLLTPARNIDRKICNLTVEINDKLAQLNSIGLAVTSCGCGTTVGVGITPVYTGSRIGYERITIDRQDSEDRTHTGVNPFSVGIFGARSNLTTGIGSATTIVTADLGKGIKTNKVVLTGIGQTVFVPNTNPLGISTCVGVTCAGLAASITTLTNELTALRSERDDFLQLGGNDLKDELKVQYTRRHSLVFGIAETEKRTKKLKTVRAFAEDPSKQQYFDE